MRVFKKGGILVENLGRYIQEKREQKKLSLEQLSKKTLISPAVLKDIEAGKFDRYEGEEAYVKMYLKKISQVLDLDIHELTEEYMALTREIELDKIQSSMKKEEYNEELVEKSKQFTFKTPHLTKKPSVYEDKSHIKIIRTAIILLIVCLIIVVCWYGFYATRSQVDNPSFEPSNQPTVEGDVSEKDNPTTPSDQPTTPQIPPVTEAQVEFTRVETSSSGDIQFDFTLPEGSEEFTFKIEFMTKSWARLLVNGRVYNEFTEKVYHKNKSEDPEVVELTFKVADFEKLKLRNGCSLGHRYYINGQQIPLNEDDSFESPSNLNLTLKK